MATYTITGPVVGIGAGAKTEAGKTQLQGITEVSATAKYALGTRVVATDENGYEAEFMYAIGVASLAAGDAVDFAAGAFVPTRTLAATIGKFAVAMAAIGATSYGWFAVRGTIPVNVLASCAINPAYTTSTAGSLDDAVVAGSEIPGGFFVTAIGTPAAAQAYLQFPETTMV